jgi:hypothetical protein
VHDRRFANVNNLLIIQLQVLLQEPLQLLELLLQVFLLLPLLELLQLQVQELEHFLLRS